eukprot:TRINITY_DN8602_c0_g3_i2.p1 TRINITY_DN8602_c0_g3~~TRINITY_DN8602_c0_g3_i2.p1  ORF type:complete len:211 (+),score=34.91 TRINITY_DN8602_c0_g3_i2:73-705(+)
MIDHIDKINFGAIFGAPSSCSVSSNAEENQFVLQLDSKLKVMDPSLRADLNYEHPQFSNDKLEKLMFKYMQNTGHLDSVMEQLDPAFIFKRREDAILFIDANKSDLRKLTPSFADWNVLLEMDRFGDQPIDCSFKARILTKNKPQMHIDICPFPPNGPPRPPPAIQLYAALAVSMVYPLIHSDVSKVMEGETKLEGDELSCFNLTLDGQA